MQLLTPLMCNMHDSAGPHTSGARHKTSGGLHVNPRTLGIHRTARRLPFDMSASDALRLPMIMKPPTHGIQGASLALGMPAYLLVIGNLRTFEPWFTSTLHAVVAMPSTADPSLLAGTMPLA